MTVIEVQKSLKKLQPKAKQKPPTKIKPAKAESVRPEDVTAQKFAERVRILAEDVINKPGDYKMGLEFILRLALDMEGQAPAVDLGTDQGLRLNAKRIVRALEITDLTPERLVQIVEQSEYAEVGA
jgi:hypothetical protein